MIERFRPRRAKIEAGVKNWALFQKSLSGLPNICVFLVGSRMRAPLG